MRRGAVRSLRRKTLSGATKRQGRRGGSCRTVLRTMRRAFDVMPV
jgi:hypothetical protein